MLYFKKGYKIVASDLRVMENEWMNKMSEWFVFKVTILHCEAILDWGQFGLMRWILVCIMPQVQDQSLDLLTSSHAHYHCATDSPTPPPTNLSIISNLYMNINIHVWKLKCTTAGFCIWPGLVTSCLSCTNVSWSLIPTRSLSWIAFLSSLK